MIRSKGQVRTGHKDPCGALPIDGSYQHVTRSKFALKDSVTDALLSDFHIFSVLRLVVGMLIQMFRFCRLYILKLMVYLFNLKEKTQKL